MLPEEETTAILRPLVGPRSRGDLVSEKRLSPTPLDASEWEQGPVVPFAKRLRQVGYRRSADVGSDHQHR
jgi:hypothetical protein